MHVTVEKTADGSPTVYVADIDEHYHSTFGALTESEHVYINQALRYRASTPYDGCLRVFEMGLGTGLNAVLSLMTGLPLFYHAVEKYPLQPETLRTLDFGPSVNNVYLENIHNADWNKPQELTGNFTLLKQKCDFTEVDFPAIYDVIFMDAFAPEKQPELWTDEILAKLAAMLAPGGVMTTYCAKGRVRRAFEKCGLEVQRLPGPKDGKREILRAVNPALKL